MREGARLRRRAGCDRDIRTLPGYDGKPFRPVAFGRSRRYHSGGVIRLPAFQITRLCQLPSGCQCGWQSVSAAWHFSSAGVAGTGAASRPQPAKRRNHRTLFPRRQRADIAGGREDHGHRPARPRANRAANRRHRRLPQHADRHLSGSVGAAGQLPAAPRPCAPVRNWPGVLGISLLLVLLTWLLLRGIDPNAPTYAMTLRAFDDYALAEASLHRDVLQARAGLLRDYDSLNGAAQAMGDAVTRLHSQAQAARLDMGPVDRLAAAVAQQEELTERFKTSNALRQNSLSYVGLISTSPAFRAHDAQLASATDALAAAILYLSRDTSDDAVKALQQRIDQFAEQAPAVGPDAEAARAMLAHARLLYDELPAVDATLKAFSGVPSRQLLEEARALFSQHRARLAAEEQRYRLLLYLVSLLLLILLVLLGLRLRARAVALRRRAAFEHVIAQNSTRLINCSPAETEARLKEVLGEFGRTIGAHRAYVLLDEKPMRAYTWSEDGKAFPPGWPGQALALPGQLGAAEPDIVSVPDVTALPPGPVKDVLTAAGVRGWVSVPVIRSGPVRSIMGFDAFRPIRNRTSPVPIVRLAADAVANAVEREFLERERAKLTVRLEAARRMQMVGSLASGIAHNFNNIIAAILGYSEMIEPQLERGTKPARHIDEIRRAAERGRDLVDNILTFGRRTDARVRPVQVRILI